MKSPKNLTLDSTAIAVLLLASALFGLLPAVVLAAGNPYISPTLSATPNHGPTGTVTTVKGTGFSAGVTITISSSTGVLTVTPTTITTSSSGGFTASVTVVAAGAGAIPITATGSDIATVTKDHATTQFTVDNVNSAHSTSVTASGGQVTVNDTTLTGVSVVVTGLTGVSGSVTVTTSSNSAPPTGVSVVTTAGTLYFDVNVALPPGTPIPAGAVANICVTNPGVTSGMTLQYWTGSAWVDATNITQNGSRLCGDIPLSALVGTPLAAVPGSAAADYTYIYIGVAVIAIIVVVAIGLFMRRRRA